MLMEYKLAELLDVPKLQALLDSLDELYSIPSAIIDIEGNILTATSWQDICTRFHRVNPESEKECIKSDTHIVSELSKGKAQVIYECPQGLVDTATPIVVDGKHLGNAFTGQFFLEPPDEQDFRRLARKYGFDEGAYIEAMTRVPIITEDKHKKNLKVLSSLTEILAEQGLKQKRQLEVEQALRESRESFKVLVEFTNAIHWELDFLTKKFTYISPQIRQILGYSPERWATFELWAETIHPDDREYAVNYCMTETSKGEDHSFLYRVIADDGKTVWLHDIVKVISHNDRPIKLIGVMLDITESKQTEENLIAEKAFTEFSLNSQLDTFFVFDPKTGQPLRWNKSFSDISGYTDDEIASMKAPFDWYDEEDLKKASEAIDKVYKDGKASLEISLKTKNGKRIPTEYVISLAKGKDDYEYIISIGRDVTDRKETENKLRQYEKIVSASKDRMAFLDTNYRYLAINDAYLETFKIDRSEFVGKTVADILGEDVFNKVTKPYLDDCLQGNTVNYQQWFEFPGTRRSFLNVSYYPYKELDGTTSGIVVNISDISAIKLAEEKISRSLQEKEVLIKEVHHRVKNNMAIISSLLNLQSEYVDDKKYLDMLKDSQSRIRSMALVHEKLYKSVDFSHIDVRDYIETLTGTIKSTVRGNIDVDCQVEVQDVELDIDVLIPCGLIMNEILTNAFKHAFNGQDNPTIVLTMLKSIDGNISLSVTDNGVGLPEGFDISRSAGLGLKLIRILSKQIGGNIEVDTENGTTFRLTFPDKV